MADLDTIIHDAAKKPRKAQGDSGSIEMHSLPDQIAAAKFLAEQDATAATKTKLPIRLAKIKPGGAI